MIEFCEEHPNIKLISVKNEDGTIKQRCAMCDMYTLAEDQTKLVDRKKKQIKPSYPATFHEPSKYSHITDINYGKSYKEILKEQQDRHKSKLDVMVGL